MGKGINAILGAQMILIWTYVIYFLLQKGSFMFKELTQRSFRDTDGQGARN